MVGRPDAERGQQLGGRRFGTPARRAPLAMAARIERAQRGRVLAQHRRHRIFQQRELAEESVLLERAAQALPRQFMGRQASDDCDRRAGRALPPHCIGDGGEARALAGAVGADDAEDLAGRHVPRHVAQRDQRAVADGRGPRRREAVAPVGSSPASYFMTSIFAVLPSMTLKMVGLCCACPLASKVTSPKDRAVDRLAANRARRRSCGQALRRVRPHSPSTSSDCGARALPFVGCFVVHLA